MMKRLLFICLLVMVFTGLTPALAQRANPEELLARQSTLDQGLFFALAKGDVGAMVTLRAEGADPNTSLSRLGLKVKDIFGPTAPILDQPINPSSWPLLHWAVYLDKLEAVKVLLRSGARLNTPDMHGATALHWAAWGGRHDIAKLLLDNGASCRAVDIKRRTAKDWAVIMGQYDMVRLLESRICHGPAAKDSDGDGVPDDQDLCPNTPYGAPVDERGCWVVAYASFFDFDKSVVKPKYLPHLAEAASVLKNYPELLVEIQGHTDSVGTDQYNYGLGQRRAEAVKKVLVKNGVNPATLNTSSKGESQPIATNATSGGRSRNRRVEIHVAQPGATASPAAPAPADCPGAQAGGPLPPPHPEIVETCHK
ncbi:MAG: OmpA family protein [Candidatus Adiutrix sp.]|jgi:outer membrane protein OmpA-like peptidoglycan-associated protein|nr:OmpA family protein [Candidatus Adiutrix sp.]